MYETVSETFYYNQGSGNFIAGGIIYENPIFQKVTTIYHNNCTNINGFIILKSIKLAQESLPSAQKLNRVRVDIGSVSGSLSELMQYSTLAGFNDDYQQQTKPRLVGTWTINNYYTASQLSAAHAAFDGLTIVENQNYLLDFSQIAVQTLNPNEDNYNPAVAIILQGENKGTFMDFAPLGYGKWFLTKTQAYAMTSIGRTWFDTVTTVTDTNSIVSSNNTATYNFNSFNELQYFNIEKIEYWSFRNCSNLQSVTIPSTVKEIQNGAFLYCSNLKITNIPTSIETLGQECFRGVGSGLTFDSSELLDIYLPNLKSIGDGSFDSCKWIKSVSSLGTVTYVRGFTSCVNLQSVIIPNTATRIGNLGYNTSIITMNINEGITEIDSLTFRNCSNLQFVTIPSTVTTIGGAAFFFINKNGIIHFLPTTPPTIAAQDNNILPNTVKIYVGDGSSAANDNAILQAYLADTNWATYIGSSRLDTWYNYLHPTV
jgi:hypothetical protein